MNIYIFNIYISLVLFEFFNRFQKVVTQKRPFCLVKLGNIIYCIKIIFSYSKKSKHLCTVLLYSITWKKNFLCTFFDTK